MSSSQAHPCARVVFSDGSDFDPQTQRYDLVAITIDKRQIDSVGVGPTLERLLRLTDSPEAVAMYQDRLVIAFSGYDGDRRELYQIHEVVAFMRELTKHWGYWYHFMAKDPRILSVVLQLLIDIEVVEAKPGKTQAQIKDLAAAQKTLLDLFVPMNSLYATFGLGLEANIKMTDKVNAAVCTWLGVEG